VHSTFEWEKLIDFHLKIWFFVPESEGTAYNHVIAEPKHGSVGVNIYLLMLPFVGE
jgi:hypothetical protein